MNAIDHYINQFDGITKERLLQIRMLIKSLMPNAEETIRYQMPTYRINNKNVIHFAGYKNHIGLYPTPSGITAFTHEIKKYPWAKGSVQFPHTKPFPLELIKKITQFRMKEVSGNV